ncbi:MAG TPA: alpha/beta hydrolase-fold protein [Gemmatimonadales bacterium]|nr:alpha/beta hydrolase-fold protein [Gemmatimonadales bacterium]
MPTRTLTLVAIVLHVAVAAGAQSAPVPDSTLTIGTAHTFASRILGEARPYLVYRPPVTGRLAVIVLLDGDGHFHHTSGAVRFLMDQGRLPPALVVAVPNTGDRTRDLTPATSDTTFRTAGGAERMLAFLADELLPHIDSTYPTHPFRILIGHSFGGLFAVHAWLSRPEVFRAYVAISPSLWWDGERLIDSLAARLSRAPAPGGWLYATMGAQEPLANMVRPFQRAEAVLRERAPASLWWRFALMTGEDHGSTPHRSTYDALEAIFEPLRLSPEVLASLDIEGLDRHYEGLRTRFGFPDQTPEVALNQLGYILLQDSTRRGRSLDAFRENVRRFPASANTYDSLGDGYRTLGLAAAAHACYGAAVRVGRAAPDAGGFVLNAVIVPVSAGKMIELARELGRPAVDPAAVPESVTAACLAGTGG